MKVAVITDQHFGSHKGSYIYREFLKNEKKRFTNKDLPNLQTTFHMEEKMET